MQELSFENIMSEEDIEGLFNEAPDEQDETPVDVEEIKEENKPVEIDPDNLFQEKSESVDGGEDDPEEGEDPQSQEADVDTSPKTNFYSSIATALRDEGILPDLDDDSLKNINDAEAFAQAIESQVKAKLDERQRRVSEALDLGIEVTEVQKYENTIKYLDSITDDLIADESDQGETLRRQIIMQDYINKGFSKERAEREAKKSFSAGTDIDDAKDALEGNKEYFSKSYKSLIDEAKAKEEEFLKDQDKRKEELKKSLLDSNQVFDGVTLDKKTRQAVWDNLTKPVYRDDKGNYYSAIQKYELENKSDFMKKIGVLFTLTDGFKSIDKLVGQKVKQEKKKSIRDLERTLKSTNLNSGGPLDFLSGASGDLDSNINLKLDI